jgi:hypothetical protein
MEAQMEVDWDTVVKRIRVLGGVVNVRDDEEYDDDLAAQLQLDQYKPDQLSRAVDRMADHGLLRTAAKKLDLGTGGIQKEPVTMNVIEISTVPPTSS